MKPPPLPQPLPVPGAFAYNVHDVAQLTRVSVRGVQMAVAEGNLHPIYPNRDAHFTPAAVAAWVATWEPDPPNPLAKR